MTSYQVKFLAVKNALAAPTNYSVYRTLKNLCGLDAEKEEDLDKFMLLIQFTTAL